MKILYNISFFLGLFYITGLQLYSQNETKIWYFGNHAGLDFNTNPPTILTNGALGNNSQEGSACISDQNGNLLFYTDGQTIWDKTHNPMANGTGLFGHNSTTQSSLIIKKQNSTNLYYVFTLDYQGNANGLCYSIVDMSLAAGNGSVVTKNIQLFTPSEEKLTCAMHANGVDVWILTHDFNSQNFRAHLLTANGINTTAVISSVGMVHNNQAMTTLGQMKASPNGKKIALAIQGLKAFEFLDFDNSTGLLSNPILLADTNYFYGCEFSSDSKKLYAITLNNSILYQWDLCNINTMSISQSKIAVTSFSGSPFSMQLAPDKKIYIAMYAKPFLALINSPNELGAGCNFVGVAQSIATGTSASGLPNFPPYLFKSSSNLTVTSAPQYSICAGGTFTLSASGATSYTWNFGTTGSSATITPTSMPVYSVIGTSTAGCLEGFITVTVNLCTEATEITHESNFKVYPTLVVKELRVESQDNVETIKIVLYNSYGNVCYSQTCWFEKQIIDFEYFHQGIYYLRIETHNASKTYKLLKE